MGLALLCVERGDVDGLVFGVEPLVSTEAGKKFSDFGQGFVVSRTQLGRVGHAVKVTDSAPSAPQFLGGHVQHFGNFGPARGKIGLGYRLQRRARIRQQHVNRWGDVHR